MKTKTSRRRVRRSVRSLTLAAVPLVLLAFGACGGGKGEPAEVELPECDAYVTTYRTCSNRQGLGVKLVETRAAAMRADFAYAATREPKARGDIRRRCEINTRQLEEACR
jgi:hypothetical protein